MAWSSGDDRISYRTFADDVLDRLRGAAPSLGTVIKTAQQVAKYAPTVIRGFKQARKLFAGKVHKTYRPNRFSASQRRRARGRIIPPTQSQSPRLWEKPTPPSRSSLPYPLLDATDIEAGGALMDMALDTKKYRSIREPTQPIAPGISKYSYNAGRYQKDRPYTFKQWQTLKENSAGRPMTNLEQQRFAGQKRWKEKMAAAAYRRKHGSSPPAYHSFSSLFK